MKYFKYLLLILLLFPISVKAKTKGVVDITKMSIKDLEDALDKGYLTSELLVKLYLERIETYNDDFNAIREINENALSEAKKLDKERSKGNIRSEVHGIPILVKNNIDVKGMATTGGSKALGDNLPNDDAYAIKKLKEAGAIIIATTNMSEFAFKASDSYSSYGQVKNAFNPLYSPYGSSGGSAVALALSFGSASLGTDTNSSVRVPAAGAGLVGLRPTYGLIIHRGVIPYDTLRDTIGIMTKTVSDNALILSIIGGKDGKDDTTLNAKNKQYKIDDNKKDIKIGIITSYLTGSTRYSGINGKTDSDIENLAKEKIEYLKNNFEVVEIPDLVTSYYQTIANSTVTGGSFCDGFNEYIKNTKGSIRSFKDLNKASGKVYDLNDYMSSCNNNWKANINDVNNKKEIFANHIEEVFKEYDVDVIVYPTIKNKNFKLGESNLVAPGSFLGSVIGYPSITVPMGYIEEFSYGLEFFTSKYNEELLYDVANYFEKANNLELTNSKLAPNLYEIPEYITDLKNYYEKYYDNKSYKKITKRAREYFLNYANNSDKENEELGNKLIEEYRQEKLYSSNFLFVIIFIIGSIFMIKIIINMVNLKNNRKLKRLLNKF